MTTAAGNSMPNEPQDCHVVVRTSPKGGPFIGKCALCGAEGLKAEAALEPCENPKRVSKDQSVIDAILG
jgi:hypothetical protein